MLDASICHHIGLSRDQQSCRAREDWDESVSLRARKQSYFLCPTTYLCIFGEVMVLICQSLMTRLFLIIYFSYIEKKKEVLKKKKPRITLIQRKCEILCTNMCCSTYSYILLICSYRMRFLLFCTLFRS